MNYLPTNLNTIIALLIVVIILTLYYAYYFIQNMIQTEIKDFYIKTEKRRLRKEKTNRDILLQQQNIELQHKLEEKKLEENFLDMENFDNDNEDEINNLEIESFIDPIKNKKSSNNGEIDQNQILADRIFNN